MNARQCLRCTRVIETSELPYSGACYAIENSNWLSAWLAGYCTPMCQRNSAIDAVHLKTAWWMKEGE